MSVKKKSASQQASADQRQEVSLPQISPDYLLWKQELHEPKASLVKATVALLGRTTLEVVAVIALITLSWAVWLFHSVGEMQYAFYTVLLTAALCLVALIQLGRRDSNATNREKPSDLASEPGDGRTSPAEAGSSP